MAAGKPCAVAGDGGGEALLAPFLAEDSGSGAAALLGEAAAPSRPLLFTGVLWPAAWKVNPVQLFLHDGETLT